MIMFINTFTVQAILKDVSYNRCKQWLPSKAF